MNKSTYYLAYESPVGELLLTSDGTALTGVYLPDPRYGPTRDSGWLPGDDLSVLTETRRQLEEYFRGERTTFDVPLAASGTPFQQRVWRELCEIPYGRTWSYGELATRVGNPKASRAVGLANGRNPISIIVPCHRVIGADGSLTGYGGGLPCKKGLLAFESGVLREGPRAMPALATEIERTLF